ECDPTAELAVDVVVESFGVVLLGLECGDLHGSLGPGTGRECTPACTTIGCERARQRSTCPRSRRRSLCSVCRAGPPPRVVSPGSFEDRAAGTGTQAGHRRPDA